VQSCLSLATARGLLARDESTGTFVFSHEGIQQASYNLIAEVSKRSFHLKIGRKLTRKLHDKALESHLFVVARQLMLGDSSVTENEEVAVLASLYLRAGEKAVEQSNFETALLYLGLMQCGCRGILLYS
jgi:predicted ATPase